MNIKRYTELIIVKTLFTDKVVHSTEVKSMHMLNIANLPGASTAFTL